MLYREVSRKKMKLDDRESIQELPRLLEVDLNESNIDRGMAAKIEQSL